MTSLTDNNIIGTWRLVKTLAHNVAASASKGRIGGEQKRFVHFEGEHMVLTQKPRLWQGVMQHRALHWERIADAPVGEYPRTPAFTLSWRGRVGEANIVSRAGVG